MYKRQNQERPARLTFHPASPGNSECLLYIHNDDADRNEECIRFDLSYMKDATNPYDKFAGLYGAKTYWGYDGADTVRHAGHRAHAPQLLT